MTFSLEAEYTRLRQNYLKEVELKQKWMGIAHEWQGRNHRMSGELNQLILKRRRAFLLSCHEEGSAGE